MARDNTKDITHQDMRAKLSDKSKGTASSLKSAVSPKSSPDDLKLDSAEEILGSIYDLMVKNRERVVKTKELEQRLNKEKKKQDDTQHQEILKALTVRRKPGRKKKEELKKPSEKTPEKAPEKKPEAKKPEAKKPEAKKPEEKKPEAKKPEEKKGVDKATEKAKKDAEAAEKKKLADKAKKDAEEKAKKDAADKAKKDAEEKAKKDAADKAKKDAADKAKKDAEEKAKKDAAEKAKKDAQEAERKKQTAEQVKEKPAQPTAKPAQTPKPPEPAKPAVSAPSTGTATKVITGAVAVTAAISGREALAANISKYESGDKGYNAYNRGDYFLKQKSEGSYLKSHDVDFSKMTITDYLKRTNKKLNAGGELDASDPNVLFAIGKYQIIPGKMKDLVKNLKIDPDKTYLTPQTQDMLFAKGLTSKAGYRGVVDDYINGKVGVTRDDAILALSMEFASIGVPYDIKAKSLFKKTLPSTDLKKGDSFWGGLNKAHNPPEAVGAALDVDRASKSKTTTVPSTTNTGTQVNQASQQNKDLKDQAARDKAAVNVVNQSTNVQQGSQTPAPQQKVDDRPPILRK